MPFQFLHDKGVFEINIGEEEEEKWKKKKKKEEYYYYCCEPRSVLEMRRSESHSPGSSAEPRKHDWASDLPPIPTGPPGGAHLWDSILSPNTFCFSGDLDHLDLKHLLHHNDHFHQPTLTPTPHHFIGNNNFNFNSNMPPGGMMYQQQQVPNSQSQQLMNLNLQQSQQPPIPNLFTFQQEQEQEQQHIFQQPQPKRHNPGPPDPKPPYPIPNPLVVDELYRAAEAVGGGNFTCAQAILARLNQLSPAGKPLLRAAFHFKEALQHLILLNTNSPAPLLSPSDVIFRIEAYKLFSEVSPVVQFANFTCTQALLEALSGSDRIHIVDFDIGLGAHWASFIQELPKAGAAAASSSLTITAILTPSTHHPVQLHLLRHSLAQFASHIGLNFDLQVLTYDSLDQLTSENEAVVAVNVNLSSADQPLALRIVKQLSPKIVVSLDRGCDGSELPFPQHILQSLQSHVHLLESLDACNVSPDAVSKIERFVLQPRIEGSVLGRLRSPVGKALFASAGFKPVAFSNYAETQAECVVRRTPVRGFRVEKRQASLVLCWQGRELISASAWNC